MNKRLGQHFLRCRWVISTLIQAAKLNSEDVVLEIGPGTGILTRELVKHAARVIAVEKDRVLAEKLRKEKIAGIQVIKGDILKLYPSLGRKCFVKASDNFKVVANIPYYLTSRLLRMLLEQEPRPSLMVLTVQKEVAQRICAKPPKMNLLAVSVQVLGRPEIVKKVPAECFIPRPRVESAIIRIADLSNRHLGEAGVSSEKFFRVAKIIFGGRRKIILNNIASALGKPRAYSLLQEASIDSTKRAGELTVAELIQLARNWP